jgi:hypothetical protein
MGTAAPWNSMGLKRGHGPGLGHKALGWAIPNADSDVAIECGLGRGRMNADSDVAINPWAGHGRGNNDSQKLALISESASR